jgi:hypothetical protein
MTKKELNDHDFSMIEEFFQYIIECKEKGNDSQCRRLFAQLTDRQKQHFFEWVEETYRYEADDTDMFTSEMRSLKEYFMIQLKDGEE